MTVWPVDPDTSGFATSEGFRRASTVLMEGGLVGVPTETVYGLAADATDAHACAGIFAAKERPRFNPLISHVPDLACALDHGVFDSRAMALAEAFWPGALTLVVPKRSDSAICDLVTAGLDSVALRLPDAPVMRALASEIGRPLAAPSANRSGRISPTTAQAVLEELAGRLALILDAGATRVGVESTIVALVDDTPRLLRPGGVAREEIEDVLKTRLAGIHHVSTSAPLSPGMLSSHYAPRAAVRLDADHAHQGEAYLGFGALPHGVEKVALATSNLSATGDLHEAAAALFSALRFLDATGATSIAVATVPRHGLGEAINDRLSRAAADRPRN